MWEFEIVKKKTRERRKIYGYTVGNAFRRFGLDREEWILIEKREMAGKEEMTDKEEK